MPLRIALGVVLATSAAVVYAQSNPMSELRAARSLKCHFGEGISTQWSGSNPKTSVARFDEDVHFDAIDLAKQTARLVGNAGANDVSAFATAVGISFIETAPWVVDVTTVYAVYGKDGNFIAADTRHVLIQGGAMAEQYYGSCKIWQ